jgi:hypothetical protein
VGEAVALAGFVEVVRHGMSVGWRAGILLRAGATGGQPWMRWARLPACCVKWCRDVPANRQG